jgi:ribonuclease HI
MSKKAKYYTVWKGHHPGVFERWEDCKAQITDYKGAVYKSFKTFNEAKTAFRGDYRDYVGKTKKSGLSAKELELIGDPNLYSISVDAASSGNPGKMEYRGVDTQTHKELFRQGPFEQGTNNIGEFLAIVHGLAYLKQRSSDRIIYTDSRTALSWVKKKRCNTKLKRNKKNNDLFKLVDRAIHWLETNEYQTVLVKWETKAWGEIPADFGRK